MADFSARMKELYQKKVIGTLEKKVRAVALKVDEILVSATPVDTGRARANWQVNLNTPLLSQIQWPDKTKKDASFIPPRENDGIKAAATYKISDTIYISNNLPYIQRLNDGWSQQTAAGFVESAIEIGRRIIK